MSVKRGTLLSSWNTKFSADSVEFCPVPPHQGVFVVGTYQLLQETADDAKTTAQAAASTDGQNKAEEDRCFTTLKLATGAATSDKLSNVSANEAGRRTGSLYLHKLNDDCVTAKLIEEKDMSAILDMKWSCHRINGSVMLAVVTSVGEVVVFILYEGDPEVRLDKFCQYQIGDGDTLALSLDWSNRVHETDAPLITVSDSKGNIHILELSKNGLTLKHEVPCHSFEAWITAFNAWNTCSLYSGGDDCKFKGYDIRCGLDSPTFVSKLHSAGVTSLHSNPQQEHRLASGSYDENVFIWDVRNMRRPVQECAVGGGVWRVKWKPGTGDQLLSACMYNNFHVLEEIGGRLEVVASYEEHDSIAYGVDWCWKYGCENSVASASFYDKFISLWKF